MRTEICKRGGQLHNHSGMPAAQSSTHCLPLERLPVARHPAQPPPASQASTRRVKQVEAISITDARDLSQQAAAPKVPRRNVSGPGEPAQVGAVKGPYRKGHRHDDDVGDPVPRLRPVRLAQRLVPRDRAHPLLRRIGVAVCGLGFRRRLGSPFRVCCGGLRVLVARRRPRKAPSHAFPGVRVFGGSRW